MQPTSHKSTTNNLIHMTMTFLSDKCCPFLDCLPFSGAIFHVFCLFSNVPGCSLWFHVIVIWIRSIAINLWPIASSCLTSVPICHLVLISGICVPSYCPVVQFSWISLCDFGSFHMGRIICHRIVARFSLISDMLFLFWSIILFLSVFLSFRPDLPWSCALLIVWVKCHSAKVIWRQFVACPLIFGPLSLFGIKSYKWGEISR